METYLGTEEAAGYLGIKERKLYDLVAQGAVPCSKVTGKWLFPRAALDRWVESGLAHPSGFSPFEAPPIIGGSHDPLLEWAARRSGSGLALLSEGSEAGLAKLDRNEVAIAAIHLHALAENGHANRDGLLAHRHLHDGVIIAFAKREQGLMIVPGNPLGIGSLADALRAKARFGQRQNGAGAQLLLEMLLARADERVASLSGTSLIYPTGQDLAFAIRAGEVDCGIATRAVASANALDFVPLLWESFDLAMRRRIYFEPGPQKLVAILRTDEFHLHAKRLGGFETSAAGTVIFNR